MKELRDQLITRLLHILSALCTETVDDPVLSQLAMEARSKVAMMEQIVKEREQEAQR